ncbi:MAG TPA: low affinity iron permease family protein [Polyangiaceae bacterium]|nr:low affinity iron permease family protein [Polyangiaceae bacterium]
MARNSEPHWVRAPSSELGRSLEHVAQWAAHRAGSSWAFASAVLILMIWLAVGPWLNYSDTWQLAINTGTTIVTFLMVFLIQRAQNKDALAIQLKLNEIVAALQGASNRLIDIEDLSEGELDTLHQHFRTLASIAKRERDLLKSHSVEEAETPVE